MIGLDTPRYAKMLSWKYSHLPSEQVAEDLAENHLRIVSRAHIQELSYKVAHLLDEQTTEMVYTNPVEASAVCAISIGRDGAMLPLVEGGYREAMVGTISFLDKDRQPLHNIYLGDGPQYGKADFDALLSREINQVKAQFPNIPFSAVADGAAHNWLFLEDYASTLIIDWWHAWQYIRPALGEIYTEEKKLEKVVKKWEATLKDEKNSVVKLLAKLKKAKKTFSKEKKATLILEKAITYLSNHKDKMNYAHYLECGLQIGSGVTESACKTMIKARFCGCGMRWEKENTKSMTLLRGLVLTKGRWEQAWKTITKKAA